MEEQYFCSGKWFKTYQEARQYAEYLQQKELKYSVVFTKAEKDSIINAIDHELECGK